MSCILREDGSYAPTRLLRPKTARARLLYVLVALTGACTIYEPAAVDDSSAQLSVDCSAIGPSSVRLHEHIAYTGACIRLEVGERIGNLGAHGWNDRISSIRPGVDVSVIVYQHTNFQGERWIVGEDEFDLRAKRWNDDISSIEVVRKPRIQFFQHINYQGASITLRVGETMPNLPSDLGNQISSARVIADGDTGVVAELFDGTGFSGASLVLTADEPNLIARGFNDVASSLRVSRPSCSFDDLRLDWPLRGDPGMRPSYGNSVPYQGSIGNYVALASEAMYASGQSQDFMGNPGGHNGIDIGMHHGWRQVNNGGVKVHSSHEGTVVFVRDGIPDHMGGISDPAEWKLHDICDGELCDGSGNVVYIQHPNGMITQYAHLKIGLAQPFHVGQWLERGTYLGVPASSGASSGPHLHYGVYSGPHCRFYHPETFSPTRRLDPGLSRIGRGEANNGTAAMRYGVFISPYFVDPLTGEDLWAGDVPVYRPHQNAPADIFDVYVSATPIHYYNPADNIDRIPLGETVYLHSSRDGAHGSMRFLIVAPSGAQIVRGPFAATFVPTEPGIHTIHAQRDIGSGWETRATETLNVLDGLTRRVEPTLKTSTVDLLSGPLSTGRLEVGETDQQPHASGVAGVVHFANTIAPHDIAFATLRVRLKALSGTNPMEKVPGAGTGWGGRLFVDLMFTGPTYHVILPKIAQLDMIRAGEQEADVWGEGVIDPDALAALTWGARSFRIYFEIESNLDGNRDALVLHGDVTDPNNAPQLVVYHR